MGSRAKSARPAARGFTLIEVLLVLGIVAILASISTSAYSGFRSRENLEVSTMGVVQAIRHAQSNAQVGKGGSTWGVALLSGSAVIFAGESYEDREPARDQEFGFPGGVAASGLPEVVFAKVTGLTSDTGDVILTNSYGSRSIAINAKGTVSY